MKKLNWKSDDKEFGIVGIMVSVDQLKELGFSFEDYEYMANAYFGDIAVLKEVRVIFDICMAYSQTTDQVLIFKPKDQNVKVRLEKVLLN